MCGIAGGPDTVQLLEQLQHRGQETHVQRGAITLGHVLHPIVGHVTQPLQREGVLVANCELYGWQALAEEHGVDAANDADLLLALLDGHGADALDMVDGVYALAYLHDDELLLARDRLGVKPLYYSTAPFRFASERQALEALGATPRRLHPRQLLSIDTGTGDITRESRRFYSIDEQETSLDDAADAIADTFLAAVEKRVPDTDVGVLFSGGVDSTMIAAALQRLDVDFTCYTAGTRFGNVDAPRDVDWARRVADEMGFDLAVAAPTLSDIEEAVPDLVHWTCSASPVDIGVALSLHHALRDAPAVVMSGIGSEQLYAGYSRQQGDLNKECRSGLRGLFRDDLERDDIVTMRNRTELRLPFLDDALVRHALTVPGDLKVRDGARKYVLREAAEGLGVPEDVAWRDKTAAQYGSNTDKALKRLAKDADCGGTQTYLQRIRDRPDHRLAALVSGGKDSHAALYRMLRRNCAVGCIVSLQSENPDSYMFDSKDVAIVERQAAAMEVPLVMETTAGEKESELADLERAMRRARDEHGVDGVVAGALASQYQRDRVDRVADAVGLAVYTPLWATDPEQYLHWLLRHDFRVAITEVAARGLDEAWVGRELDEDTVAELIALSKEHRFNAAGEGGEYETVVRDAPHFAAPIADT